MSLYDDLCVSADADDAAIKAAHRDAAKRHHPDRGGDPEAFAKIQRAALVLRDPEKRARYDQDGTVDYRAQVDVAMQDAVRLLNDAFQHALTQADDLRRRDVTGGAKHMLEMSLSELRAQILREKAKKDRLVLALGRLGHKGKGPNYLANVLNDQIGASTAQVEMMQRGVTAHERAIEMAADYTWQVDEEPSWQGATFTFTSTTGC
jgi:curved DNA-binding protein CbpA